MRLIFYITIWDEFIVSHTMVEAIHTSSSHSMSVVVVVLSIFAARKITCQEALTLNYVIFVMIKSLLRLMIVIRHGDHDRGITEDKQKEKKGAQWGI
jgi:cytochrome bd-type quinol oxidase subunit 1